MTGRQLGILRNAVGIGRVAGWRAGIRQAWRDVRGYRLGIYPIYDTQNGRNADGSLRTKGWMWTVPVANRSKWNWLGIRVFLTKPVRHSTLWHEHDDHRGLSFVFRGGYVEEHCGEGLAEDGMPPDGPIDRIQVRAPCLRWVRSPHRVRGTWGSLFIHIRRRR